MSRPIEKVFLAGTLIAFGGLAYYGWGLATEAPDVAEAAPRCENRTIAAGDELSNGLITISIYNAGDRAGLASSVRREMASRGFQIENVGNSTSEVVPENVAILAGDKDDPRVQLIAAQFDGPVDFASSDIDEPRGVIAVLTGADFVGHKADAPSSIEVKADITVCVPPVPVEDTDPAE